MPEIASLLEILANLVPSARLQNGIRVLDPTDFQRWLEEVAADVRIDGVEKAIRDLIARRKKVA